MNYLKKYESFSSNDNLESIIVYHRSTNNKYLEDLSIEKSRDVESLFGKAIYFSSSPSTSSNMGKYMGKYEIKLDKPLNMNKEISNDIANKLYSIFSTRYNIELESFDFDLEYDGVQYGEFFSEISQDTLWDANKYFNDFIKNYLGYNSFYHYSNYHTDFITEKGDYGLCFGIYNKSDIKFIDYAS